MDDTVVAYRLSYGTSGKDDAALSGAARTKNGIQTVCIRIFADDDVESAHSV